jgi:TRAP-type transport system small permease protein
VKTFETVLLAVNRWVLILLLGAMSVIVFTNVASRYLTGDSIPWAEEVARHMMIWLTFLGCGLVLRSGGHIAIDNLQDALSARAARWLRAFIVACVAAFFLVLMYVGCLYVQRTLFQLTAATQIPFGYIYLAMPVGCALTLVHLALVARLYIVERAFMGDEDFDANASAAL